MGKGCFVPLFRFHSQNQLAREGSQSVSPLTIPALTTIVDRQLKEDRTLSVERLERWPDAYGLLRKHSVPYGSPLTDCIFSYI